VGADFNIEGGREGVAPSGRLEEKKVGRGPHHQYLKRNVSESFETNAFAEKVTR